MELCSEKGCTNNSFGGGKCKYHQFRRYMQGGDKHKAKPRQKSTDLPRSPKRGTPIPKESEKRKLEHKTYIQHCRELEQEIRDANNGKIYCFFSGLEITGQVTFHHLKKRTGSFYTDKEWLVPVINDIHVYKYHQASYEQRIKEPWWEDYLKRLRQKSEELYLKEIKIGEKSVHKLNPSLFSDEEDLL